MHEKNTIVLLISVILSVFRITYCDWVSDWMVPLQSEIQDNSARRSFNANPDVDIFEGVYKVVTTGGPPALKRVTETAIKTQVYDEQKTVELKMKLKNIIKSAQELADNLKLQIDVVSYRENMLKDAIANGRYVHRLLKDGWMVYFQVGPIGRKSGSDHGILEKPRELFKYYRHKYLIVIWVYFIVNLTDDEDHGWPLEQLNNKSGVSTVTVSTTGRTLSSNYIIRDGFWTLCNGVVQTPVLSESTNLFNELFASPRCIGQEVSSSPDPCVFNSLIKYEVVPTRRGMEYYEEEYLCLRKIFNTSLEQYLSVPKRVINETCRDGEVRSVASNTQTCGVRVLSEYAYYPHRSSAAAALPLEYCAEPDGSCRLLAAWHVSNSTVEHFEFLKREPNFKKYFIKTEDRVI